MYAFLPREAVTRFLMSCSDCQKRMHLQYNNGNNSNNNTSCGGATPFSVLSNSSKNNISLISPLLHSNVTGARGASEHVSRLADDSAPEEEDEEEADEDGVEDECRRVDHSNVTHDKESCRVLVDCRLNSVVDIEEKAGERRGRNERAVSTASHTSHTSHTRQHPDSPISKRTNGTSNKRKVSTKSTSASASAAESSSIPKRIRTSQDHCHSKSTHPLHPNQFASPLSSLRCHLPLLSAAETQYTLFSSPLLYSPARHIRFTILSFSPPLSLSHSLSNGNLFIHLRYLHTQCPIAHLT